MIDSELCYSGESLHGNEKVQRLSLGFDEEQDLVESVSYGRYRDYPPYERDNKDILRTHPDDQIDPFIDTELTVEQYLICGASIWGFVTKLRTWGKCYLLSCSVR
jgi:hypothetical protein